MALVGVVTGTRKTHIIFLWTCLDVLSQPRGYYDAFADARAGCSAGGEWLLLPEGTARADFFCAFHFIVELLVGCCCVSIIAGPGVTCKLARHMTAASILRYFRSMPQVVRRAAALGCCAGQPRCVPFLVEGHCGEHKLSRHTPQTRCFTFVWHHSVMRAVISLRFTRVLRCVLQDTSRNFGAFLVGFRSVTPCCLCCFDFWVPWSSHAVRFCSLSGVGSVSSRQPCSTFGSSISTVEVCSLIRGIRC